MFEIPLFHPCVFITLFISCILFLVGATSDWWTSIIYVKSQVDGSFSLTMNLWGIHASGRLHSPRGIGYYEAQSFTWNDYCNANYDASLCKHQENEAYCEGMDGVCGHQVISAQVLAMVTIVLSLALLLLVLLAPPRVQVQTLKIGGITSFFICATGLATIILWVDLTKKFGNLPVHLLKNFPIDSKMTMEEYAEMTCLAYNENCWAFGYAFILFTISCGGAFFNGFSFFFDALRAKNVYDDEDDELEQPFLEK